MVGRGRSKRPSRSGLARVGGDVRLSVRWLRHRRCRQAGSGIDPLADGETQPRTRNAALAVVPVDPGELPEQLGQKIVGQPRAVVANGEGDLHAVLRGGQPDGGRLRGVPCRVGQEVADDLGDAPPVRHDRGQVRLDVYPDVVPAAAAQERVPGPVHQGGGVRRLRTGQHDTVQPYELRGSLFPEQRRPTTRPPVCPPSPARPRWARR